MSDKTLEIILKEIKTKIKEFDDIRNELKKEKPRPQRLIYLYQGQKIGLRNLMYWITGKEED